jgi:hypothetical protein
MLTHKTGMPAYGYDLAWGAGTPFTRAQLFERQVIVKNCLFVMNLKFWLTTIAFLDI